MTRDLHALLNALAPKYTEIMAISNWNTMQGITDIDSVNAILDKRALLISEILALTGEKPIDPAEVPSNMQAIYLQVKTIIKEIQDYDRAFMDQIQKRMNEIKAEIAARFTKQRALGSYMRHQYAIAR